MPGPIKIAVANAKGGCAKTTTVLHLAVAYAQRGLRVLVVDMDPQGTLTRQLGISVRGVPSVKEVLLEKLPAREAIVAARANLDVLGADLRLALADIDLATSLGGDTRLRRALQGLDYDLVLIDCPPAIARLTANALVAADAFLVPVDPSPYSLEGLDMLQPTIEAIRENYTPDLAFLGPVLVLAERRTVGTRLVREQLDTEWGEVAFKAIIRKSQRTRDVSFTQDTLYDGGEVTTTGNDYLELADEIAARVGLPVAAGVR